MKAQHPVAEAPLSRLPAGVVQVKRLAPVLPVLSRRSMTVPFETCSEMLEYGAAEGSPLWKLAVEYESQRAALPESVVLRMMVGIVRTVCRFASM